MYYKEMAGDNEVAKHVSFMFVIQDSALTAVTVVVRIRGFQIFWRVLHTFSLPATSWYEIFQPISFETYNIMIHPEEANIPSLST